MLCGQFEYKVDEVLTRHKIEDLNVLSVFRTEKRSRFPFIRSWIETDREISPPFKTKLKEISRDLETCAKESGLFLLSRQAGGEQTVLELGKDGRIFQKLIFFRPLSAGGLKAAIVIDDVAGRPADLHALETFFALKIPLTFAVLPMERLTKQAAGIIRDAGQEIIMHQPMEPEDLAHNDPGKAALLVNMNEKEIEEKTRKNFFNVPHALGISNHMGSRFTGEETVMESLLKTVKKLRTKRGTPVFFLDSRTNLRSVARQAGKRAGMAPLENDIFLDNADDPAGIAAELDHLRLLIKKRGAGVAIGHVQRVHLAQALKKAQPQFRKDGIRFVFLSKLHSNKIR